MGIIIGPLQFAHFPPTRQGTLMWTGPRPPVRSPWRHCVEPPGDNPASGRTAKVTFQGQLGLRHLGRGVVTLLRETHPQRTSPNMKALNINRQQPSTLRPTGKAVIFMNNNTAEHSPCPALCATLLSPVTQEPAVCHIHGESSERSSNLPEFTQRNCGGDGTQSPVSNRWRRTTLCHSW